MSIEALEPEDILSSSLQTLYEYQPITLSSAGSLFTYTPKHPPFSVSDDVRGPLQITLCTPDTRSANWSLHASAIWMASLYLADHINDLHLDAHIHTRSLTGDTSGVRVLEFGAGAGLPGILIAKTYGGAVSVTLSDYPDDELIQTLSNNVHRNRAATCCRVVPYAWGSNPDGLLGGYDVVIAADTLWNPSLHMVFIESIQGVLKESSTARVHLVAGLHTGRYTIQGFLTTVAGVGFVIERLVESEVAGGAERPWRVSREDDEQERRRWVVWIVLKWDLQ